MKFNINDFIKLKDNGYLVWQILETFPSIKIEHKTSVGGLCTQTISTVDLYMLYVKTDKNGNVLPDDASQMDWFGNTGNWTLPKGYEGDSNEKYCAHDWRVYHGLNFSDEFCTKCNAKREVQKP